MEYLTTAVIMVLMYVAVIGVLLMIGGEDEIAEMEANARDGEALSDTECAEVSDTRISIAGLVCCYCDECVAERELRARAKDGNA